MVPATSSFVNKFFQPSEEGFLFAGKSKEGSNTLARLPLQIQHYDVVFERKGLVATPNHLKKA